MRPAVKPGRAYRASRMVGRIVGAIVLVALSPIIAVIIVLRVALRETAVARDQLRPVPPPIQRDCLRAYLTREVEKSRG